MAKVDFNSIGKCFVEHYYKHFDGDRTKLADLFKEQSCLSFEGKGCQGKSNIMNHICREVQFTKIQHSPRTLDVQPSGQGLLVMVTGELKVDEEKNALLFTEVFHLIPIDNNFKSFWVKNAIFRLNYGNPKSN